MAGLVFVVDDEPDILELVSLHLRRAKFKVREFREGSSFLKAVGRETPDLVILDLMLPDEDGLEICKHLKNDRRYASIPIIMLTAKGEEADRVLGLELGADDYVTKPFSPRELVARVKAVTRRKSLGEEPARIEVGNVLVLDLDTFGTLIEGRKADLTATEFRILRLLASKQGRVFSREQILDYLWGSEKAVLDRTVDVHIKNLREKMRRFGEEETDLTERFIRSSGRGGQHVNKASTSVYLKHNPTGIEVKCGRERSQALNRFLARRILADKFEAMVLKRKTEEQQRIEKIRRQKRKRSRRAKQKMLEDKHHQSRKKQNRTFRFDPERD